MASSPLVRVQFDATVTMGGDHFDYVDISNVAHKSFKLSYDGGMFVRVWHGKKEIETAVPLSNVRAMQFWVTNNQK